MRMIYIYIYSMIYDGFVSVLSFNPSFNHANKNDWQSWTRNKASSKTMGSSNTTQMGKQDILQQLLHPLNSTSYKFPLASRQFQQPASYLTSVSNFPQKLLFRILKGMSSSPNNNNNKNKQTKKERYIYTHRKFILFYFLSQFICC